MDDVLEISPNLVISSNTTRFSDGDPAGIVYFTNYPMFFDEAFIEVAKTHGFDWGQRDMRFIIPIVEQKANYRNPLRVGQMYHTVTAITHTGNSSFQSSHAIFTEVQGKKQLMAHGYITRVVVDPETFRSVPIPTDLQNAFSLYRVDTSTWDQLLQYLQS